MKKALLTGVAVLVAAALVVGSAAADGSHGRHHHGSHEAAGVAFGAGTTNVLGSNQAFAFRVKDGGPAASDRGVFGYCNRTAGFCYRAQVSCVSVSGNVARIGYVIPNQANLPAGLPGTNVVWEVVDSGHGTPDQAGFAAAPASTCDMATVPTQPITSGRVSVGKQAGDDDEQGESHGGNNDDNDD
jgi:hypothetical protein